MTAELTIVIPTLNERENIWPLIDRLTAVLAGINWEVIFVDDNSTDGTLDELKTLSNANPHVRFLHRIGQRGLSSACLEGMGATASPFLAVMDADLQHDEALLPQMLQMLRGGETDLVVGSRYISGGGVGSWSQGRRVTSRVATRISHLLLKVNLSDPMSGFFMIRREVYEDAINSISGKGFKILIDLVASVNRPLRTKEIPFVFRQREHGESKLDTLVMWEYLMLIADKSIGRIVPVRFVLFVLVGCLGACLHLIVLGVSLNGFHLRFILAQSLATVIAMTVNYFINNLFTYHDQRLRGWRVVIGLATFMSICAVGAVINVDAADFLYKAALPWWLAGLLGAGIGSVWNYAVSSALVWRRKRADA